MFIIFVTVWGGERHQIIFHGEGCLTGFSAAQSLRINNLCVREEQQRSSALRRKLLQDLRETDAGLKHVWMYEQRGGVTRGCSFAVS